MDKGLLTMRMKASRVDRTFLRLFFDIKIGIETIAAHTYRGNETEMRNLSIRLEAGGILRLRFLSRVILPKLIIVKRAVLLAFFLVWPMSVFPGYVQAFSLRNVDTGVFKFGLELRSEGEVNFANLDLIFLEGTGFGAIALFDDLVITNSGQFFAAAEAQENFGAVSILLTNRVPDWIKVQIAQSSRTRSIQGTEPALIYGDFTGDSGIDFAGMNVRFITLETSSAVFEPGFDPDQGLFTDIMVEGWVSIILDPITVEMFATAYGSIMSDTRYSVFGDADGDGDVDGVDIWQLAEGLSAPIEGFAAAYGSTLSDMNYRVFNDVDRDGDVDGADLALLLEHYKMSFEPGG